MCPTTVSFLKPLDGFMIIGCWIHCIDVSLVLERFLQALTFGHLECATAAVSLPFADVSEVSLVKFYSFFILPTLISVMINATMDIKLDSVRTLKLACSYLVFSWIDIIFIYFSLSVHHLNPKPYLMSHRRYLWDIWHAVHKMAIMLRLMKARPRHLCLVSQSTQWTGPIAE